jgi:hypothetical protein
MYRRARNICAETINETVSTLCPFQKDIRTAFLIAGNKNLVEPAGFFFQYPGDYFHSGLLQTADTLPANGGKGVTATDDNPADVFLYNQIHTRRGLTIVRTGLKVDVQCGRRQKLRIPDSSYGIYFRMGFPCTAVVPFADNPPVVHHHGSYHRIG